MCFNCVCRKSLQRRLPPAGDKVRAFLGKPSKSFVVILMMPSFSIAST